MKINIAIVGPKEGIGGYNLKFKIIYRYLDNKLFNKYYILLDESAKNPSTKLIDNINMMLMTKKDFLEFVTKKDIQCIYDAHTLNKDHDIRLKNIIILKNTNFASPFYEEKNTYNLIISKTLFLKLSKMKKNMKNSTVVYNPIDLTQWASLNKTSTAYYREKVAGKNTKLVIGRLARAEPSKWDFLIIKTITLLQKSKNKETSFIFAGMPLLHRLALKLFLNKEMKKNILFLPELKNKQDIARFYKSIDIFWQTSEAGETFGNVIAESFCFKKPVITDSKHFMKNHKILTTDNAQIELVDHGINGLYCNYPDQIEHAINSLNKKDIERMGEKGYTKVKKLYDAKYAAETISRIVYDILRERKIILKNSKFEKTKRLPTKTEIKNYEKEYNYRLSIVNKQNKKQTEYVICEKLWKTAELAYLGIRKLLRFVNIDIEKFESE